jgi:small subunit ribosomal protein S17
MSGKTFEGTVVSNKMTKTITVTVSRKFREQRLGKIVGSRKKYKVHCEDSSVKPGDVVSFTECAPVSKDKKFRMVKVLQKADVALATSDEA